MLLRVVTCGLFKLKVYKRIVLHVLYSTNEVDINVTYSSLKIAKRVPQSGQKRFLKNGIPIFPLVSQVNRSIKRDACVYTTKSKFKHYVHSFNTGKALQQFPVSVWNSPVSIQPSSNPPDNSHKTFNLDYTS